MEALFPVRWIRFLGDFRPVIMQNENGPCPLLAIANVVSLVGRCPLPTGCTQISGAELVSHVADYLMWYTEEQMRLGRSDRVAIACSLDEALPRLPGYLDGLDVDPLFDRVTHFAPSHHTQVFEAADIRLMHGWVVDPETEPEAAVALHGLSYNLVVDKVIACIGSPAHTRGGGGSTASATASSSRGGGAVGFSTKRGASRRGLPPGSPGAGLGLCAPEPGGLPTLSLPSPASPVTLREVPSSGHPSLLGALSDGGSGAGALPLPPTPHVAPLLGARSPGLTAMLTPLRPTEEEEEEGEEGRGRGASAAVPLPAPPQHPPPLSPPHSASVEDVAFARVMRGWLDTHPSQLTLEGVKRLLATMKEAELACFFRNNHFSALFKHDGCLYALVTDEGFLNVDSVVWERLDSDAVKGGATFVDDAFVEAQAEFQEQDALERALQASSMEGGRGAARQGAVVSRAPPSSASAALPVRGPSAAAPGGAGKGAGPSALTVTRERDSPVVPDEVPADMREDYLGLPLAERAGLLALLRESATAAASEGGAGAASAPSNDGPAAGGPSGLGRNDKYGHQAAKLRQLAAERQARQGTRPTGDASRSSSSRESEEEGGQGEGTGGASEGRSCTVQ